MKMNICSNGKNPASHLFVCSPFVLKCKYLIAVFNKQLIDSNINYNVAGALIKGRT